MARDARGPASKPMHNLGVGVLATLRGAPEYRGLSDHGEALRLTLTEGASRFGFQEGRGYGFRPLFAGLANRQGALRFRSGNATLRIDGTSPNLVSAQIAALALDQSGRNLRARKRTFPTSAKSRGCVKTLLRLTDRRKFSVKIARCAPQSPKSPLLGASWRPPTERTLVFTQPEPEADIAALAELISSAEPALAGHDCDAGFYAGGGSTMNPPRQTFSYIQTLVF